MSCDQDLLFEALVIFEVALIFLLDDVLVEFVAGDRVIVSASSS